MSIFGRFKKKVEEDIDELTCDVCGNTLKDYKKNKNNKVCQECYEKINQE